MIFTELELKGAFLIELEKREDERGFFARAWCQDEFEQHGLNPRLVQCNISFNEKKGTLRGMHYQVTPLAESKLVRCTMGAAYDVIIDIRPASPTFGKWKAMELSAENWRMVFIPEGFAHGFQTLTDRTELFYQMSEFFHPECGRGIRWNDPFFNVVWPDDARIISASDQAYPDFLP